MAGISRAVTTESQGSGNTGREGKGWGLRGMRYSNAGGTEPTVLYLILLIIAEVFAYGALRYAFRGVHGG